MTETDLRSKSESTNQLQRDRIASVNNWRGQCLDNFARVEYAIIRCSEELIPLAKSKPFKLEEAAGKRTQTLRDALKDNWSKQAEARQLMTLLDHWSIREKERNNLVHGRFAIRAGAETEWLLVNELLAVKKGVVLSDRTTMDARQADAFLKAIVTERKQLEDALKQIPSILA